MFPAIRQAFVKRIELLAEVGGLVVLISGATIAVIIGKAMLAVVLGAVTFGFVMRLARRRANRSPVLEVTPTWVRLVSGGSALVEVAVIVEATNLPVRFDQPGFQLIHWLLVAVLIVVAYLLQVGLFNAIKRNRS
jgi:hypothetical protein